MADIKFSNLPSNTPATSDIFPFVQDPTGTPVGSKATLGTLKTALGLTGTNSGDQTSIVGITGTTAQFNTANTDGDFATLAGSETLTNKSLTSPTLTGTPLAQVIRASGSAGIEIKNSSGTDVIIAGAGGGTGLSLEGTTNIGSLSADYVQVSGGTGTTTQTATGSSADININLVPKGTGRLQANAVTVPTISSTDTLTNKTMTGATNTLTASVLKSATTEVDIASATAPTSGQVLTATSGTAATWQTPSGGVSDGDKGDITVSSSGTVWNIDAATVGVTELSATGTPSASTYLRGDNTWATVSGTGDVSKVGTPVDNQIGVWTGNGTIEGTTGLTYDGSNLQITGDIGSTGSRITKGWFTDLQVTNDIAGNITGNAATVTTNANLTGMVTSVGNTASLGSFTKAQLNTAVSDGDVVYLNSTDTITGVKTMTGLNSVLVSSSGLTVRNPANTFSYTITGGAIAAARTLNLPVITATDTLASLGLAQTFTGAITFNNASVLAGAATMAVFNTVATNLSLGGAATTLTLGGTPTTAITHNYSTNATANATTKTVNLGTGGAAGSTSNINIGSVNGGTTTVSSPNISLGGTTGITTTGTIELGAASDTTLSRSSAGVLAVEGVVVPTVSSTNTLTNKTLTSPTITTSTLSGKQQLAEGASIALDPAATADGVFTGTTVTGTAGYTQAFGDLVYLDPTDSRWEAVDANAAIGADGDARGMIGMVVSAGTDGTACTILLNGIIRADAKFPTLTINGAAFASETAGLITQTAPTTSGVVVRNIGTAITADEIYFNPSQTWLTVE